MEHLQESPMANRALAHFVPVKLTYAAEFETHEIAGYFTASIYYLTTHEEALVSVRLNVGLAS